MIIVAFVDFTHHVYNVRDLQYGFDKNSEK